MGMVDRMHDRHVDIQVASGVPRSGVRPVSPGLGVSDYFDDLTNIATPSKR